MALRNCQPLIMRKGTLVLLICLMFLEPTARLRAAEDAGEIAPNVDKAKQQQQIKEMERAAQLEKLRRDQELNHAQQQLDSIKRSAPSATSTQPNANQVQQQLDQMKTDQELQRMQNQMQLDRARRETNPARQQEQFRELQRQQQMDLLQEQNRKIHVQQELDRLRQQQPTTR